MLTKWLIKIYSSCDCVYSIFRLSDGSGDVIPITERIVLVVLHKNKWRGTGGLQIGDAFDLTNFLFFEI